MFHSASSTLEEPSFSDIQPTEVASLQLFQWAAHSNVGSQSSQMFSPVNVSIGGAFPTLEVWLLTTVSLSDLGTITYAVVVGTTELLCADVAEYELVIDPTSASGT